MNRETISRVPHIGDEAVSEIVGTLILIVIAVSVFSAVSLIVLNPWSNFSDVSSPQVSLVGFIQNNSVIIEHQGGIPLDTKTKITVTIAAVVDTFSISEFNYWIDENGDGFWSIGECVVYPAGNLQGKQVSCVIVDEHKNFIIFDKIIQKGTSVSSPYTTVLPPDDVSETSATLKMYYDFYDTSYFTSGFLNFTHGIFGGPYFSSPSVKPLSIDGWYGLQLSGLLSGTQYECWARMNFSNGTNISGPVSFYTYQITRGFWHFDELIGSTFAHDEINPICNGTVHGATFITGGKINGSLNFTGISNYVDVPHHPKFNLTNEITIQTWLNVSKIGAQFPGNVSELSTKNISDILGISCFEPDLIQVIGTMYAIAYRDNSSAYVTTFQMTDDGVFLGTIDTKSIAIPHFFEPNIIKIHNNIYAIVYGAADDQAEAKSHIVTLSLYGNGTIGDIIDSFDTLEYYGREPNIINIGTDIYAIAIGGTSFETFPTGTGYLVTISIDSQGDIGPAIIDKIKFPLTTSCSEPSLVHITGDMYAITYNGFGATAGNGYIITVHILNNGSIIEPLEDTYQFGLPEAGLEPSMIHVTNDIYAISYGADSNDQLRTGFIKTLSISPLGHIVNGSLDILPFYTYLSPIDYNFETDIMHIDDELYAISFTGGNNSNWQRGFLTTISINDTGNISDSALFIYEFKGRSTLGGSAALNLLTHIDRLIIVYGSINSSERGFLTMEKIDLIGDERSIIQKGDAYAIMVNYNLLTARMAIGNTTYTVSGTVSFDNWTKIDLTYGGGFLKMYVNDVIQTGGSEPCSGTIKTNTDHLIFGGGVYGSIDEIKIFRGVYVPP
jgi:flagellin-like protein